MCYLNLKVQKKEKKINMNPKMSIIETNNYYPFSSLRTLSDKPLKENKFLYLSNF